VRVQIDQEQVQRVFCDLKDRPAFADSAELIERGKMPVEMLQAMALRPGILESLAQLGDVVYPGGTLERPLKEKVILKASRVNNCQFCINSHQAIMRQLGIPEDDIQLLEESENVTPREELALQYTRAVMDDSGHVSDSLFGHLHERFSDQEIVELTYLIGFINMLNLFNNALQVTYREDYEAVRS